MRCNDPVTPKQVVSRRAALGVGEIVELVVQYISPDTFTSLYCEESPTVWERTLCFMLNNRTHSVINQQYMY